MTEKIFQTDKPTVIGPANFCIYCGEFEGSFTKEHIIPESLGGGIIYLKSSCNDCQKITSRFENSVTNDFLKPYRGIFNAKSKKKGHDLKIKKEIEIFIEGKKICNKMQLIGHPPALPLPIFDTPAIFTGKDPVDNMPYKLQLFGKRSHLAGWLDGLTVNCWLNKPERRGNVDVSINYPNFAAQDFARMLAKIGHGIAMVEFGLYNFIPILNNFILGTDHKSGPYEPSLGSLYIGCRDLPIEINQNFSDIRIELCTDVTPHLILVSINFFPWLGSPWYVVGVGYPSPNFYKKIRT